VSGDSTRRINLSGNVLDSAAKTVAVNGADEKEIRVR
jgi:hypothetical protein